MAAGDVGPEEGCGETTSGEPCQLCLRKGRLCLKHSNNKPIRNPSESLKCAYCDKLLATAATMRKHLRRHGVEYSAKSGVTLGVALFTGRNGYGNHPERGARCSRRCTREHHYPKSGGRGKQIIADITASETDLAEQAVSSASASRANQSSSRQQQQQAQQPYVPAGLRSALAPHAASRLGSHDNGRGNGARGSPTTTAAFPPRRIAKLEPVGAMDGYDALAEKARQLVVAKQQTVLDQLASRTRDGSLVTTSVLEACQDDGLGRRNAVSDHPVSGLRQHPFPFAGDRHSHSSDSEERVYQGHAGPLNGALDRKGVKPRRHWPEQVEDAFAGASAFGGPSGGVPPHVGFVRGETTVRPLSSPPLDPRLKHQSAVRPQEPVRYAPVESRRQDMDYGVPAPRTSSMSTSSTPLDDRAMGLGEDPPVTAHTLYRRQEAPRPREPILHLRQCHCGAPGLFRCGACTLISYCSSDCQRADWPSHAQRCREVVLLSDALNAGYVGDPDSRQVRYKRHYPAGSLFRRAESLYNTRLGSSVEPSSALRREMDMPQAAPSSFASIVHEMDDADVAMLAPALVPAERPSRARGYMNPDHGRARIELEERGQYWAPEAAPAFHDMHTGRAPLVERHREVDERLPPWHTAARASPAQYEDPGQHRGVYGQPAKQTVVRREVWRARGSGQEVREHRTASPAARPEVTPWDAQRAVRYEYGASHNGGTEHTSRR